MIHPIIVRLEILRHGPPHNQLLSPLTQYLALCGNHPSVTVNVPYEHAHFLARHDSLSYNVQSKLEQDKSRQRELQLQITAQEMSQILARVPGLISELRNSGRPTDFIHFELVLSASELALLPFELANAPNGFPGAGQSIVLQSQSPMCITRRVNRVDSDSFKWPERFKILFAEGLPDVDANRLVPQHLLALRRAIDPWIGRSADDQPGQVPSWVNRYLKVLRRASIEDIQEELQSGDYTHIHLLAHGVPYTEGVDHRFALQLRSARNRGQLDTVSATRLAALLRSFRRDHSSTLSQPAVVTIASCHGAEQGSVMGAGSSIAHALHEADIPLVISSQFPLSFQGSVIMVENLYRGLLWGADPRVLLSDLRRQLKAQLPETHDWASIVAYAALPGNIVEQLEGVHYSQVLRSIEAAFSFSDKMAYEKHEGKEMAVLAPTQEQEELNRRLADSKRRLRQLRDNLKESKNDPRVVQQLAFMSGRLASAEKREAELDFNKDKWLPAEKRKSKWLTTLQNAEQNYRAAFDTDRSQTWALVQSLILKSVINDWKQGTCTYQFWRPDSEFRRNVAVAQVLSRIDERHAPDREKRAFAIGDLIELVFMSLRCSRNQKEFLKRSEQAEKRLSNLASSLSAIVEKGDWQLVSTRRQLSRYLNWFYVDLEGTEKKLPKVRFPEEIPGRIRELCLQMLEQLPEVEAF